MTVARPAPTVGAPATPTDGFVSVFFGATTRSADGSSRSPTSVAQAASATICEPGRVAPTGLPGLMANEISSSGHAPMSWTNRRLTEDDAGPEPAETVLRQPLRRGEHGDEPLPVDLLDLPREVPVPRPGAAAACPPAPAGSPGPAAGSTGTRRCCSPRPRRAGSPRSRWPGRSRPRKLGGGSTSRAVPWCSGGAGAGLGRRGTGSPGQARRAMTSSASCVAPRRGARTADRLPARKPARTAGRAGGAEPRRRPDPGAGLRLIPATVGPVRAAKVTPAPGPARTAARTRSTGAATVASAA